MLLAKILIGMMFAGPAYILMIIGTAWTITGSFDWPQGWIGVSVLWGFQLFSSLWLYKFDPDLLRERMEGRGNSVADKLATVFIILIFFVWFAGAALDVHVFNLLPSLPVTVSVVTGLVIYAAGNFYIMWTMRVNSFAASVVRIQEDRHQTVIDTGPYGHVRHPMYTGLAVCFTGLGLILGSTTMAILATPVIIIGFLPRILIEEKTLTKGLEGYAEYLSKTRWRMIPWVF